ncbi:hypothetical protein AYO21_08245 [Fonsecaea monophora]|uniref:Uncharacterized protein n=1 Tax=Fonsecaea monophora TaxID=254056 RepID=A0A177EZM8_9EURO|nr:hypothetical protein AYO21_08245 [Fonsecaea monophora]KAH0848804.1 hypothetical protein FOPE_03236 [Fonsecaea pedrosoi]OAG37513.1 hypothetical protein AYO21_08245 [Fonsecaea monophora]
MSTYSPAATAWRNRLTSAANGCHRISGFLYSRADPRRHPSPLCRSVATVVDQTKIDNKPHLDKRDEHTKIGKSATSGDGRGHPAKQPDPQKPPERSTGVETQGSEGKSGEGRDTGGVHKEEIPDLS